MYTQRDSANLNSEIDWLDFCKQFGIQFTSVVPLQSGNMKKSYRIVSKQGEYVAQQYKYGSYLINKFDLIRTVSDALNATNGGMIYPQYIPTTSGEWFVHGYNLQKYINNKIPLVDDARAQICAKSLKSFHESCDLIKDCIDQKLLSVRQPSEIDPIYSLALEYGIGIIHGEFRLRNLLFQNNKPIAIIDLDSICLASRYIDIGYLMLDFIERDISNFDRYIEIIHSVYSENLPIQAGYAAVALTLSDYIHKCNSGYLHNNRILPIKQYNILLETIYRMCN